MDNKLVSIIIRTKNEERWIKECIERIKSQTYKNYEIIIVDNNSTDNTLNIVKNYPEIKLVFYNYDKYYPGKSLNLGCKFATGEYFVFISGHCLPSNENWLKNLVISIESDPQIAGVYGRQEPMEETNLFDRRDLILIFGLDKRIQWKDPFFHNANSIIKASCWREQPFNEDVPNIEDRVWAANMQKRGYCILYNPDASVLHYHGIHQGGLESRCLGVNRVIDNIDKYITKDNHKKLQKSNKIIAVIPFSKIINNRLSFENIRYLYDKLVTDLIIIDKIEKIYLLTDYIELIEYSKNKYPHITIPYKRENDSEETLLGVLQTFLHKENIKDDISIFIAELIFIIENRKNYFTKLCDLHLQSDSSSSLYILKNNNSIYKKYGDKFYRLDEEIVKYKGMRIPFYESNDGLGRIILAKNIKNGYFHNKDIQLIEKDSDELVIKIDSDEKLKSIRSI